MASRRKPAVRVVAVAAAPPSTPREHRYPAWYAQRPYADVQHAQRSIRAFVEQALAGQIRLPRFQRPWLWSDEQIARLFDSLLHGYHVGSLLIWEQRDHRLASTERFGEVEVVSPADCEHAFLVDGQQRVGALLTAAASGRFWVDLQAGALVTEPGPWRMPADALLVRQRQDNFFAGRWCNQHAVEHGIRAEDVEDGWLAVMESLERSTLSAVILGRDMSLARVMETYRRLALLGTPMDPAEVEAGLRRAMDD